MQLGNSINAICIIIYPEPLQAQMQRLIERGDIRKRIVLRFISLAVISIAFLLTRFLYTTHPTSCIRDAWHQFTNQLNQQLDQGGRDNIVIGIGQVFMDFWIIVLGIYWCAKIKNSRIAFTAGLIFVGRGLLLQIMKTPFPKHIIWHNPGFISLTVPYDMTRDFFYSGHTATLTIIILQIHQLGYKWFTLFPLLCLIYMMNMLLLTRVHYIIDIGGGLCYAFFFHQLASTFTFYSDWALSLPFFLTKKLISRCRTRKSMKQNSLNSLTDKILASSQRQ